MSTIWAGMANSQMRSWSSRGRREKWGNVDADADVDVGVGVAIVLVFSIVGIVCVPDCSKRYLEKPGDSFLALRL